MPAPLRLPANVLLVYRSKVRTMNNGNENWDPGNSSKSRVVMRYKKNVRPERTMTTQFDGLMITVSGIVTGSSGLALVEVLPGDGATTNLKVAFFAITCGVLSFFGNKISVHKLAELAALGYRAALVAAVAWFAIFGVMVATLTHTALSWKQIAQVEMREAGARIVQVGSSATDAGLAGQQVRPELDALKSRIESLVACEDTRGCLTGKPGRGPAVSRLLGMRDQIDELARQYSEADRKRAQMGKRLIALNADFEQVQGDGSRDDGERRAALLGIYLEAERVASELFAVTPTTALNGLVADLRGFRLPSRGAGSVDAEAALSEHASRLEAAALVEVEKIALPAFPSPPAITAGWTRLDLTWPYLFLAIALEGAVIYAFISVFLQFKALDDDNDDPLDGSDPPTNAGAVAVSTSQPALDNGEARLAADGSDLRLPRPRRG